MTLRWGARTGLALLLVAVLTQKVCAEVLWLDPLPAGNEHPYPGLGGNFTLDSATGAASLSDYQGKVVLLFFGYTFCPDICPTTLTVLGQVLRTL
ncbi:MAG: SCO family protein, partial [Proteobacteria bacterium]|nr:SCO family protein [Pseudomonadota bacterium]